MTKISWILCLAGLLLPAPSGAAGGDQAPLPAEIKQVPFRVLHGHSLITYCLAFSPDGKTLASGGMDSTVKLWDPDTGGLLGTLRAHTGPVNAVTFSPDGKTLVSAGEDGSLRLWELDGGTSLAVMRARGDAVLTALFSPDGGTIISGGMDGRIRLWRPDEERPYKTFRAHTSDINSLAVSADGKTLASGGKDLSVGLWDTGTWKLKARLEGHTRPVTALAFSSSGESLASAGEDSDVRIWRLPDGNCIKVLHSSSPVEALAYSAKRPYLFSGGADRSVVMWDIEKGLPEKTIHEPSGVLALAVSADDKYLAAAGHSKSVRVWLTPYETAIRELDHAMDERNHKDYSLMSLKDLIAVRGELKEACAMSKAADCGQRLAWIDLILKAKIKNAALWLLAGLGALLSLRAALRWRNRRAARKVLPARIKKETMTGNTERAFSLYEEYKSLGGDPACLHRDELLDLFRSLRIPENLAKENLPPAFLLKYADFFAAEGNNRLAAAMLRGGRLADSLRTQEEFRGFVDVFNKLSRPEDLISVKFSPKAYSGLAEAFLNAGDKERCGKMCSLKRDFHAGAVSKRDAELLAAAGAASGQPAGN